MTKQISPQKIKRVMTRIGMLSLGCPKTLVDSEIILGKLDPKRYAMADSVADCDVALLNTCSFIKEAQKESVDRILELVELKKENRIKALIVMGCLVQQFSKDLQKELTGVDAFVGSGDYAKIPEIVERVSRGEHVVSIGRAGYLATSGEKRIALTSPHYRYLKISEGCDHQCSFCTIPEYRGKHRSRTVADVVKEASQLIAAGAKEIVLTGQDTTYFGRDRGGKYLLPQLLRELDEIQVAGWIRLLYAYPSCLTDEMIAMIRDAKHICHYLDMPLQHISDNMLSAMRRGMTKRRTMDLIRKLRSEIPDLAIRTTFIVGFPGETEKDFEELLAAMEEVRFERLGIFMYSREEGTPAAALPGQISGKMKEKRLDRAMRLQQEISEANNRKWMGETLTVLVDEKSSDKPDLWLARSYMDAPDVDGNVYIKTKKKLKIGSFQTVKITDTQEYDLVAKL